MVWSGMRRLRYVQNQAVGPSGSCPPQQATDPPRGLRGAPAARRRVVRPGPQARRGRRDGRRHLRSRPTLAGFLDPGRGPGTAPPPGRRPAAEAVGDPGHRGQAGTGGGGPGSRVRHRPVDLGPGGAGHPDHHRVRLSRPSAWRLLTQRLGWSLQRPERLAKERDEQAIARWVAHEWPRSKKGPPTSTHG
jgi:winged helix-turn-helix protein